MHIKDDSLNMHDEIKSGISMYNPTLLTHTLPDNNISDGKARKVSIFRYSKKRVQKKSKRAD